MTYGTFQATGDTVFVGDVVTSGAVALGSSSNDTLVVTGTSTFTGVTEFSNVVTTGPSLFTGAFEVVGEVRHCLCLVFPLPSRRRRCLCLVFPLPSRLRHCLCLVCSTAFVTKTLPFLDLPLPSRL